MSSHSPSKWFCGKEAQTCSGNRTHSVGTGCITSSILGSCFLGYDLPHKPYAYCSPCYMASPYSALYKTIPDYKVLRVFGCACDPNLRPYNPHKFAYHSKECVFLGYSSNHKGYKCLASDVEFISPKMCFSTSLDFLTFIYFPKLVPLLPPHPHTVHFHLKPF